MTKRRWLVLLVGVIALGMVAHVVIAADEEDRGEGRGRGPGAGRGRGGGEGEKPEGRPEGKGGEHRGRPGGEGGRRPMMRRPVSPLMAALDINKDGQLDKREIANASRALAKLANKDGVITREKLRPNRPEGGKDGEGAEGGPRRGRGQGRGRGEGEEGGKGRGPGGGGGKGRGPGGGGGRGRGPGGEGDRSE